MNRIILSVMILVFVVSLYCINFQNTNALSPVADLSGEWSGTGQFKSDLYGISCLDTVAINAKIDQNGNGVSGTYSFVGTSSKDVNPDPEYGDRCALWEQSGGTFDGTLDGSRISVTLSDDGLTYTGTYTSRLIKLSVSTSELSGTIQLTATNFSPPPFEPKEIPQTPPEDKGEIEQTPQPPMEEPIPEKPQPESQDEVQLNNALDRAETELEQNDWEESEDNQITNFHLIPVDDKIESLVDQGKYEDALISIDGYLEGHPDDVRYLTNKAALLQALDRSVEALSYMDKALAIDPTNVQLQEQRNLLTSSVANVILDPTKIPVNVESYRDSASDSLDPEICNYFLKKENQCKKVSDTLKPGDIITSGNSYIVIKFDNGKSMIYLSPNSVLSVLKFTEKERIFYLPMIDSKMKAEIHSPSDTITKFGTCPNPSDTEECNLYNLTNFWIKIRGTQITIETYDNAQPKLTVLSGSVDILKGDEVTPTLTVNQNEQIALDNNALSDSNVVNVNSDMINRWWEKADSLALQSQSSQITSTKKGGGCLIATATYGSELAPQVQLLRELRDNQLLKTNSGTSFITGFNQFYYSFSPTIADWERENPTFKEFVKITLAPMISSLSILNYVNMESESSVLGYGLSLILLNIGMYFVAPGIIIYKIRKAKTSLR